MKTIKRLAAVCMMALTVLTMLQFRTWAAQSLRVGVCPDAPPYQFQDDNGRLTGMHIDFLNYIGYLKGYQMDYVSFHRVSDAVTALEKGEIDVVLGALPGDVLNNGRVQFTDPLSSSSVCMVVPKEMEAEISGSRNKVSRFSSAFELGTITFSHLSQFWMSQNKVVGSQRQLFETLRSGQADAAVCIEDSMLYMLESEGIRDEFSVIHEGIADVEHMLLVRASDRTLRGILDDAIVSLRTSSTYGQIVNQWMVDLDLQDMQGRMRVLIYGALLILVVAGMIIINGRYLNRRLKQLVSEQTRELNQKVEQLELAGNLRNRLVEHSPGGSMLVSRDGTILLINSVARTMAGLPENEGQLGNVENMRVFGPVWKKAQPYFQTAMDAPELIALNTGSRDKHTYRYQCHATNTREEMVLLVEDVTWEERRKQEIFEERKNQTLNRIIAGVAHEIKNPLMSIRTFASLITAQSDDPEFQTAFQEYVPKEVDRISKMIETLINYARPPREHKDTIEMGELVKDCMSLAYLSSKKNIPMECDVPEGFSVYANGDQLRQALVNLLINAIEAVEVKMSRSDANTEEPLGVRVTGYREDGRFVLEIFDQGSGMSEEDILQCTDPFFTTKKSGVGMGLALTKQYVKENNGQLEIESVLGEYTKMRMILKEETAYEADRVDHR